MRSFVFLVLAFAGVVFGLGQIWSLALALRSGTDGNVPTAVVGAVILLPSTIILVRIMRVFAKRGSENNIRRS